jgi:hypothetical protein
MSIFNKPYKTDEQLMEDKNISKFIREQLLDRGFITITEACKYAEWENNYENRSRMTKIILGVNIKRKLEKSGNILSCFEGKYFIVKDDKDAEHESERRKSSAIAHMKTDQRADNALNETNPNIHKILLANQKEVLLQALIMQTQKELKELKGE